MDTQASYRPTSPTELRDLVAWAVAEEKPLEIAGAGTKRAWGRPVEASILVHLDGLSGISLYEPEELVMTAQAGTPLSLVEAVLKERGQELAFEPADYGLMLGGEPGRQTVGGVFACNVAGPRRLKSGAARDHLLGLHAVTGHGQLVKAGGRVVKNVTGYDLCKLLCGSFGTLAAMTEVTFKVLPASETVQTLLATAPGEADLLGLLRRAAGSPCEISGAACLPALAAGRSGVAGIRRLGRAVAAIRLEGFGPSVAYRLGELEKLLKGPGIDFATLDDADSRVLWEEVRDLRLINRERPLWRVSVAPTAAAELAAWAAELTPERLYDWAGGLMWLAPKADWAREAAIIREAPAGRGGHATLIRGPDWLRTEVDPFEPQATALRALTERVKRSFDPHRVLNPGRMYAGV